MVKNKKEELIEKDKKNTRGKIIFIIIALLSIILIIYASLFGIKLRFNLSDELEIKLTPLEQNFNVKNNENVRLNFKIQNDNFAECKSVCEFKLIDLSSNTVLSVENQILNHNEEVDKNYSILTPENGQGEKIYSFKTECKNMQSLICFTDEKARMKSSIIFVDYELQDKEKNIISKINPEIDAFLSKVKNEIMLQEQSRSLLDRIPDSVIEKKNIVKDFMSHEELIDSELAKVEKIKRLWKEEKYLSLNSTFSEQYIENAEKRIENINLSISEAKKIINLRNNNIQKIKNFNLTILNNSYSFYLSELNIENLKNLENIELLSESINYDYLVLKNDVSFSEQNLTKKLDDDMRMLNILNIRFQNITHGGKIIMQNSISILSINNISMADLSLNTSICSNLHVLGDKIKKEKELMKNNSNNTLAYLEFNNTFNEINNYRSVNCRSDNLKQFNNPVKSNQTKILLITNFSELKIIDDQMHEIDVELSTSLQPNNDICCVFQECKICNNSKNIPTIFIHGHSINNQNNPEFSMNLFTKVQEKLEQDNAMIDAGQLDLKMNPENLTAGSWGKIGKPISVRSSYYYITYYDLGGYTVSAQKYDRIENYAIRLKEIIDLVKSRTGSDKVNVVAHSMGGLVAREYINLFGGNDINKVVTVNTPNHGISGRVAKLCSVIGSEKECEDMKENSVFLNRLNTKNLPQSIKLYAIRSVGCTMQEGEGDGIVTAKSAYLENAENFLIKGNCTDDLQTDLHSKVLDPEKYPEAYEIIKEILTD